MTIKQYPNTTAQQYDNSSRQNNMTIQQYHNTTTQQYDNTMWVIILICHNMYVHSFATKKFMIRHENFHEVERIDNIRSASDHGMNHICKLVIESEMLVVFAW